MSKESYETIAGTCAVDCEDIASRLAERIESLSLDGPLSNSLRNKELSSNSGESQCELEIEVRLGVLQGIRSDQRYYLPLRTDTLLSKRAKTRFVSNVSEQQYKAARSIVLSESEQSTDTSWTSKLNVSTVNLSFDMPDYDEPVRVTVLQDSNGPKANNLSAIRKVKLLKWDVFSGSTERDEDNINTDEYVNIDDCSLDYRIAVNLEYKVPITNLPSGGRGNTRKIQRDTFLNNGANIKFDFSCVEDTTEWSRNATSYEIELELVGSTIVKILMDQNLSPTDRLRALKYHCCTLIHSVKYLRDCITAKNKNSDCMTNLNVFGNKLKISDLRIVSQDNNTINRFKRYVSPQIPLIGDYLYRTLAVDIERHRDRMNNVQSLYTKQSSCIPGPFIVNVDEAGNRVAVLSKR